MRSRFPALINSSSDNVRINLRYSSSLNSRKPIALDITAPSGWSRRGREFQHDKIPLCPNANQARGPSANITTSESLSPTVMVRHPAIGSSKIAPRRSGGRAAGKVTCREEGHARTVRAGHLFCVKSAQAAKETVILLCVAHAGTRTNPS